MFVVIRMDEYVWPRNAWVFPTRQEAEDAARKMILAEGKEVKNEASDETQTQFFTEGESHNSYLIMKTA